MTKCIGSPLNSTTVSIGDNKKGPDGSRPRKRMKADGSGGGGGNLGANADGNHRGVRLLAMDGALPSKDAAFVDDQRTDHDVAEHFAGREDFQTTRGADVALDRATDHDIAPADIAFNPTMLADRQVALSGQFSVD